MLQITFFTILGLILMLNLEARIIDVSGNIYYYDIRTGNYYYPDQVVKVTLDIKQYITNPNFTQGYINLLKTPDTTYSDKNGYYHFSKNTEDSGTRLYLPAVDLDGEYYGYNVNPTYENYVSSTIYETISNLNIVINFTSMEASIVIGKQNPTLDKLRNIKIYTINGKLVKEIDNASISEIYKISLPIGMYIIRTFSWRSGYCIYHPRSNRGIKELIIILAGPLTSLFICVISILPLLMDANISLKVFCGTVLAYSLFHL